MATVVTMPKLGLTMQEGTIISWYKQEGDSVKEGETLFEITTEKITYEVEAPTSGILRKIIVPEGETVACQTPVAVISGPDDDISAF